MEEIQKETTLPVETQEEKTQEEELLKETPDEEVRKSVIEAFGLDEDDNKELIDKLVEDRTSQKKVLSKAITQKRTWREAAQKGQKKEEKPETTEAPVETKKEDIGELINKTVNEKLEEKELNAIEISDEAKTEIKAYAKAKGFTVKQVLDSDFFKFLKGKEDEAAKVEEAGIGGKRKAPIKRDFSAGPPKPDMSTKEGRQEWADYKKYLNEQ